MRPKTGFDFTTDGMMQEPSRKPRDTAEVPEQTPANDEGASPAAALAEGTVADRPAAEAPANEVDTLRQENAGLKDRLLRALAEMRTCAAARSAKLPMPRRTASRILPATCWVLPTTCAVPWTTCRRRRGRARMPP